MHDIEQARRDRTRLERGAANAAWVNAFSFDIGFSWPTLTRFSWPRRIFAALWLVTLLLTPVGLLVASTWFLSKATRRAAPRRPDGAV
jgi:hypothetical protein